MAKVKIDSHLYDRAKAAAEAAGYPSIQEFITHIIEKELAQLETTEQDDEKIAQQLRGLGYIE
jgi:metal-responsive CopG/Arc/MetJ family transcriptional regulator